MNVPTPRLDGFAEDDGQGRVQPGSLPGRGIRGDRQGNVGHRNQEGGVHLPRVRIRSYRNRGGPVLVRLVIEGQCVPADPGGHEGRIARDCGLGNRCIIIVLIIEHVRQIDRCVGIVLRGRDRADWVGHHGGIINICQGNRKVTLHSGIQIVLGLYAYGIGRGIGFEIKGGVCLERTVGIKSKERVVGIPCPAGQMVGQIRANVRIGRIEFPNDRTDRLVLGNGQDTGCIQIGGRIVGRPDLEYIGGTGVSFPVGV